MSQALVLAHGAFHGPWCWARLITRLETSGIVCSAVDLNRGGLEADRQVLQQEVDRLARAGHRVSVIGHSLGCASIAWLDPNSLSSLIFLAGGVAGPGMPDIGGAVTRDLLDHLEPQPDGRMWLPLERAPEIFYNRCEESDARWAVGQLRPTFTYGAEARPTPIWQQTATTYLVCEADQAVFPDFQRQTAAKLPFSESLDSDHSPMICAPDALAESVVRAMARGT